jgi:hypothetical protein
VEVGGVIHPKPTSHPFLNEWCLWPIWVAFVQIPRIFAEQLNSNPLIHSKIFRGRTNLQLIWVTFELPKDFAHGTAGRAKYMRLSWGVFVPNSQIFRVSLNCFCSQLQNL